MRPRKGQQASRRGLAIDRATPKTKTADVHENGGRSGLPHANVGPGGRRSYTASTLPGFMMFFGSSVRLMVRISSTAPSPASSTR